MDREWEHHILKFALIPFPAIRAQVASEIGSRKNKKDMNWLDKIRCEIFKIPEQIKKKYFFFKIK